MNVKFRLTAVEMIEILDSIHKDAYDKLHSALEQKVLKTMSEEEWIPIWESGIWTIETSLSFEKEEAV